MKVIWGTESPDDRGWEKWVWVAAWAYLAVGNLEGYFMKDLFGWKPLFHSMHGLEYVNLFFGKENYKYMCAHK